MLAKCLYLLSACLGHLNMFVSYFSCCAVPEMSTLITLIILMQNYLPAIEKVNGRVDSIPRLVHAMQDCFFFFFFKYVSHAFLYRLPLSLSFFLLALLAVLHQHHLILNTIVNHKCQSESDRSRVDNNSEFLKNDFNPVAC